MNNFDNSVRDWRGRVIGFRCDECRAVKDRMWGNTCDECREKERRHQELVAAIKARGDEPPANAVS